MELGAGLGHLTYCTNIHAGEPLSDVMDSLATYLPVIRDQVSDGQPMGVGLRLGGQASDALSDTAARQRLIQLLADGNYYVFTLNGFPYGAFHGAPVKAQAYQPDWSDPIRLSYSNTLAGFLAELLPAGMNGTISTVPGTFKPWADEACIEAMTANFIDHVAELVRIERQHGKRISLALEPEPYCFLETIEETVRYFEDHLFSADSQARLIAATGLGPDECEPALRRHLSVCYDVCHAAVEFESAADSLQLLRGHGIAVGKLQLSSALRVSALNAQSVQDLQAFVEPVYLHQVVQHHDGQLSRFDDLPAALAQADQAYGSEWRIHFHVPVFLNRLPRFDTTQSFLREILALHREQPVSEHLEVETYTWDVLPAELRSSDLGDAIARELNWVKSELAVGGGPDH